MPIDEVSQLLGSLETKQQSLENAMISNHGVINNKLDRIIDKMTVLEASNTKAHARIDDLAAEAVTKTGVMKTAILVGGAGGLGGTSVMGLIKSYLGLS